MNLNNFAGKASKLQSKALIMKQLKTFSLLLCCIGLCAAPVVAGNKDSGKKTCCEKAAAENKECTHKCCISAHKEGKSCETCNPNKEDLKLKKKDKEKK